MKIIFVASTSWNHFNFRLNLAKALKERGHEVILLSPTDEYSQTLIESGFHWEHIPINPRGKRIFPEIKAIVTLLNKFRFHRPELVNNFTPKGVIYGSIAAKLAGISKIFNSITGLGYVFSGNASSNLVNLVIFLYRVALHNTTTLFQNPDNLEYFVSAGICSDKDSFIIPGSGVDIARFNETDEPNNENKIVMLATRFVEEKGIRYFIDASEILLSRNLSVKFVLVGRPEKDYPTAIQHSELTKWVNEGIVEWWGWHHQMELVYPKANIVCLPSYYMEGIPKSLIEAAACGRALVATDIPGCREIVHDHYNGLLVTIKNAEALANAIEELVTNDELRKKMGKRSREIAISKYSDADVIVKYFEHYNIMCHEIGICE